MIRTLVSTAALFMSLVGIGHAQETPAAKKPADPRDELRYDGKPFAYWEAFPRTELKPERRIDALRAMAAFGARGYAKEAMAGIVEMLKEYDNDEAAFGIDPNAPEKATPDQRVIHEALWAIRKIGPQASPVLVAHLDHKAVRWVADKTYGEWYAWGIVTEPAVPVLVGWLSSKDNETCFVAIRILANAISYEAREKPEKKKYAEAVLQTVTKEKNEKAIVEGLVRGLEKGDGTLRSNSARILTILGPRAKAAVPALVYEELLKNEVATEALAAIKPTAAERIPTLLAEIKKTEWLTMRGEAAVKLAELGAAAKSALPDLAAEIKKPVTKADDFDNQDGVSSRYLAVVAAYVKIAGAKDSLPLVTELLEKNLQPQVERELMQLYLKLETDPKRAVSMVSKSLQRQTERKVTRVVYVSPIGDPRPSFTDELVMALGDQKDNAASAVPMLVKLLDQSGDASTLRIAAALGNIGRSAQDALPALRKLLQAENAAVRAAAAEAIEAITKR
jgi:HEAT repeat protein